MEIHYKHGVALNLFLFKKSDFSFDGFTAKIEAENVR